MTGHEVVEWVAQRSSKHWLGRARLPEVVVRRWIAAWLLLELTPLTLTEMEPLLRQNRATIRNGIKRVHQIALRRPDIAAELQRIKATIQGTVVSIERHCA